MVVVVEEVNPQRVEPRPRARYSRVARTQRYRIVRLSQRLLLALGGILLIVLLVHLASGDSGSSKKVERGPLGPIAVGLPPGKTGRFLKASRPVTSHGRPVMALIVAQYSPYCAAEQWAVIKALANFGRFRHLIPSSTPAGEDGFAAVPTFDLLAARYHSSLIDLRARVVAGLTGAPLQRLTPTESSWFTRYDASGNVPFVYVDGYIMTGSGYSPALIQGLPFGVVDRALRRNRRVGYVRVINAEANLVTAFLCGSDHERPRGICQSRVIRRVSREL